jgi:GGDEF domain-containing protein
MEARLRLVATGGSLLLLNVQGVRLAAVQFSHGLAQQLAGAFVRRLPNNVTPEVMLGRWSEKEFLVFDPAPKNETLAAAKLTQALSGA